MPVTQFIEMMMAYSSYQKLGTSDEPVYRSQYNAEMVRKSFAERHSWEAIPE